MKAYNKKRKLKHTTFPKYKGWDMQIQRMVKNSSVCSIRNKRHIEHGKYSYRLI